MIKIFQKKIFKPLSNIFKHSSKIQLTKFSITTKIQISEENSANQVSNFYKPQNFEYSMKRITTIA